MSTQTKIFTVDKFLGLNESADGTTELKLGEAAKIENFYITDEFNLKSRPGIVPFGAEKIPELKGGTVRFLWKGYISGKEYCLFVTSSEYNEIYAYCPAEDRYNTLFLGGCRPLHILQHENVTLIIAHHLTRDKIITYGIREEERVYSDATGTEVKRQTELVVAWDNSQNAQYAYEPYVPLAITGAKPSGGGTVLEKLNILTNRFRVSYTSEKGVTIYKMPANVSNIVSVHVGGQEFPLNVLGEYNTATKEFTLTQGNLGDQQEVVFVCETDDADLNAAKDRFLAMPYYVHFNGATDKRIFFYGDGTNISYYTSPPSFAADHGYGDDWYYPSGPQFMEFRDGTQAIATLYVPAGNELAVDFSDSPITAMVRHYSRLLVYKPDGVDQISYEPIALADGTVTAGFYLTPVNRNFGNNAPGQVALINNSPRSFTHSSIYEWRVSSGYQDERYAKCISPKVANTIAGADPAKLFVFDDEADKTCYVFLNDEEGTVLVNRYDLDVWSIYKSELTRNVTQCFLLGGQLLFLNDGVVYCFEPECLYDKKFISSEEEESLPIKAVWESGLMAFGADYKRKYSSHLWLSLLPQSASDLEVTVQTDKRSEYLTKTAGYSLLDFSRLDFSNFGFLNYTAPKIKRIQLKVKKFVYYKLILRVTKPGARATVLGYDQQVRYSSNVK